jgi:hypothetical protein
MDGTSKTGTMPSHRGTIRLGLEVPTLRASALWARPGRRTQAKQRYFHGRCESTMIDVMENLGARRTLFTLSGQPAVTFRPKNRRSAIRSDETPLFEPYAENLPLQSGFYTFVIDQKGRFRVKWGNTSSHGAMAAYQRVAAAGNFRISRIGKLAVVTFTSYDYGILYDGPNDRALVYAIGAFLGHPAFDASEHVIFHFSVRRYETTSINRSGELLNAQAISSHLDLLESEGLGGEIQGGVDAKSVELYRTYQPTAPSSLYSVERDQLVVSIEEGDDISDFRPGLAYPRYSPESANLHAGKYNFVIDRDGWLIIGAPGHHILSGGHEVAGAGHITFNGSGKASEIHLNFSGHYRPILTFDYVRYVYQTLRGHPLLDFEERCEVLGRKFTRPGESSVLRFTPDELLSDDPDGDEALERMLV